MNVKQRMCYSKKSFPTERLAIKGAIASSMKFGPMRWYKCPICHKWHLTSDTPEKRRPK